jgi:hypothetical protein
MSTAYEIFDAAFAKPRDPRSDEYRHGVIDILKYRLREQNEAFGKKQYKLGTPQADAYFAGCDEGHRLASEYLEALAKKESDDMAEAERAAMYGTFGGR